ncbi:hypothetical protein AURDEDRAFT_117339 [Auricularia subglabra TFB-10046 SS5]|uniref:Uncharacterized protein n=1 Tax=Auricularia subglabra (strain TFB-10046 / SS5) TaxID=717982 RepID=J0WTK6_AURST|nr:hypothetical protein AURDEDRAFT_117339 [Auricularia subglabra TFB-10046 SS5]
MPESSRAGQANPIAVHTLHDPRPRPPPFKSGDESLNAHARMPHNVSQDNKGEYVAREASILAMAPHVASHLQAPPRANWGAPILPADGNPLTYQAFHNIPLVPPKASEETAALPPRVGGAGPERDRGFLLHSRALLPILAATSTFGAGLAFSTFFTVQQTFPGGVGAGHALRFLAWAFAAFAACMLTTLIWQVALVPDFHGFEGRLYRSKGAILFAVFAAFTSMAGGVVFLSLALTESADATVRAAAYTVVGAVAVAGVTTLPRLWMTGLRRARAAAADAKGHEI